MDFYGNFFFWGGDIVLSIRNERMDSSKALLRVIVMEHGQFSWLSVLFDQSCHKSGG